MEVDRRTDIFQEHQQDLQNFNEVSVARDEDSVHNPNTDYRRTSHYSKDANPNARPTDFCGTSKCSTLGSASGYNGSTINQVCYGLA